MWTRKMLKDDAKAFLRLHYWDAFVVSLIATLLSGSAGSSGGDQFYTRVQWDMIETWKGDYPAVDFVSKFFVSPFLNLFQSASLFFFILIFLFLVTVGYAIKVGRCRFFLEGFRGNVRITTVFSTFNRQEYMSIVITLFLRSLYNFLWYFLFIIPGIIKYYEYRFVPYILAERPDLTANEVITQSRHLTRGHKMDLFVLDLSFIGWYFLGALLCGIGIIFINPYAETTYAQLYDVLAGQAIGENPFEGLPAK